jgi:hypothetical protein
VALGTPLERAMAAIEVVDVGSLYARNSLRRSSHECLCFWLQGLLRDTDKVQLDTGETVWELDRLRSMQFETKSLAKALLDHPACKGTHGLSRGERDKLNRLAQGER